MAAGTVGEGDLQCANIHCSNPSCRFIYSTITYEKFRKMAEPAPAMKAYYATGSAPVMTLHCEFCGTSRIIDMHSFNDLYHGFLSEFKK